MSLSRCPTSDRLAWWIATGAGSGYAPRAPGTVGALIGLGLFWASEYLGRTFGITGMTEGVALGLIVVGIWAASRAVRLFPQGGGSAGDLDPPQIVIDEIAGQFLALSLCGVGERAGTLSLWGFVLFRLFDIGKPYPLRRVERWGSGIGIMADDVLAGVYAAGVIRVAGLLGLGS